MRKTVISVIGFAITLWLFVPQGLCLEVRYQQSSELYIEAGKASKSPPHAFVTLDIQPDRVIYKAVDDWKDTRFSRAPGSIWPLVGKTELTRVSPVRFFHILPAGSMKSEGSEKVLLATAAPNASQQVGFLLIAEDYLIEVKSSSMFVDTVIYQRYNRISELSENEKAIWK